MTSSKVRLLLIAFFAATAHIMAAGGRAPLEFETTSYDFGTVKADSGPVVHEYVFVNNGDDPLAVLSVSANCGCTKGSYSPEPVMPGQKGKVTVTLQPAGQRGYLNKNVTVRYKVGRSRTKTVTLRISGNVVPR